MESYMESPLHGLTCGGLSLFRQIGLCAFSVEPLMTGLALDGFGIQVLLHLESDGIEDFLFRAPRDIGYGGDRCATSRKFELLGTGE